MRSLKQIRRLYNRQARAGRRRRAIAGNEGVALQDWRNRQREAARLADKYAREVERRRRVVAARVKRERAAADVVRPVFE